jgi:hypothetical protein
MKRVILSLILAVSIALPMAAIGSDLYPYQIEAMDDQYAPDRHQRIVLFEHFTQDG